MLKSYAVGAVKQGFWLLYSALNKLQMRAPFTKDSQQTNEKLWVPWLQITALTKERDFAMASKHAAAEAAAALETKARATAELHKGEIKALQSQISQLKVTPITTTLGARQHL